ncbi:hypothetical protein NVP1246O_66 [Vibrio phage 1.246.O._10N.261.54.E10]|nr:hypothetical protein NVP1246O_66 [Vibrio phage 1.246.O._10N.261.54.E10]
MTTRKKAIEITNELRALLKQHNAELGYTTDDDGVHIIVNEETVAKLDHPCDGSRVTYL